MEDLSLHILDCAQNSIRAGAHLITITIEERINDNMFSITIEDDGKGMDQTTLKSAQDPFFSTKPNKRIGLGISMLAQAAKEADGAFSIDSCPGQGTTIQADFKHDHIDRKPLGKMADTIITLIASGTEDLNILYIHLYDHQSFVFDTRTIKKELGGISIKDPSVLSELKNMIDEAFVEFKV